MEAQSIGREGVEAGARRPGRRRRRKAAAAEGRSETAKVKTTVALSREAWKRLHHHAVEEGCDPCVLIERLIVTGLRSVRVQLVQPGGDPSPRVPVSVAS
jgi:hypothetical protein